MTPRLLTRHWDPRPTRAFLQIYAPWIALAIGVVLEGLCFLLGLAPIWIPIHWFFNPALFATGAILALAAFRSWRLDLSTLLSLLGVGACLAFAVLPWLGSIWPYESLGLHF